MRLNAALALKLTPPTAVRWSFVSSLFFFFLSFYIFFGVMRMVVVFLHWPFFLRCFPFHLALVVSVACFFFFCFVIHTNLFFVFVFRTFFKRSAQFVRLFVRLFIAAGLHSIFIQQFCFCAIWDGPSLLFSSLFSSKLLLFYQSIVLPVHRRTFPARTIP